MRPVDRKNARPMLKDLVPRYALMAIVTLAIAYGSLYPFVWRDPGSFGADLLHLAGTWRQPPQSRGDTLANLLLYMPLGLTVTQALGRKTSQGLAWLAALAIGTLLSLCVELSQFYDVSRVSALSDVYLNMLGTLAGCAIAWAGGARLLSGWWRPGAAAAFARLLLLAWVGWRLYPYVPTIDMHKYWHSVRPLLSGAAPAPYDIFRFTALWLSVAFLFQAGLQTQKPVRALAVAMLGYFAAKILIIGQILSWPELLGAVLALVLTPLLLRRYRHFGVPAIAVALLVVVAMSRLLPWQFAAAPKAFQWIPFFSFLHGSLQVDLISFAQKFYLYGVLIALLVEAGMMLATAVALECLLLLSTSVLQMFMVARSAEATDAMLALAIGLVYALMRRQFSAAAPAVRGVPSAR